MIIIRVLFGPQKHLYDYDGPIFNDYITETASWFFFGITCSILMDIVLYFTSQQFHFIEKINFSLIGNIYCLSCAICFITFVYAFYSNSETFFNMFVKEYNDFLL